jgi:hypothetical protein
MGLGSVIGDAALSSGIAESLGNVLDYDPALASCSPTEASLRNSIPFASLKFSFPTTQPAAGIGAISFRTLQFPAFLTTHSDKFNVTYEKTEVFGRTDPIPTYKNTTRQIDVGVKIPCYDSTDANENMKKLNQLIKNLYPSYVRLQGAYILSSPPLIRVKFGNLIADHSNPGKGLLGYVAGALTTNFNIPENGVFMESGVFTSSTMFFRVLELSFTLGVLHENVINKKTGLSAPLGFDASTQGQFLGRKHDFPYRTKLSIGDTITAGISSNIGLSSDVSSAQILGI